MSGTDRRPVLTTVLTVLGCLAMLWVEWVLSPVYPVKSSAKALVFLGCAAAYVLASGDRTILRSFGRPEQGAMRLPLLLGGGVFLLLLGGYTLLSPWLDLSAISGNLQAKEGFTAATFPLAALYITFGNSLLEELFFRGFAFLALYRSGYKKLAWTFSAIAFALYHVSIMDGWFHPALLVLLTSGLDVGTSRPALGPDVAENDLSKDLKKCLSLCIQREALQCLQFARLVKLL